MQGVFDKISQVPTDFLPVWLILNVEEKNKSWHALLEMLPASLCSALPSQGLQRGSLIS